MWGHAHSSWNWDCAWIFTNYTYPMSSWLHLSLNPHSGKCARCGSRSNNRKLTALQWFFCLQRPFIASELLSSRDRFIGFNQVGGVCGGSFYLVQPSYIKYIHKAGQFSQKSSTSGKFFKFSFFFNYVHTSSLNHFLQLFYFWHNLYIYIF